MSFHEAIDGINAQAVGQKPTLTSEINGRPSQGNLNDTKVVNDARRQEAGLQAQLISDKFRGTGIQGLAQGREARLKFAEIAAPSLIQERNNSGVKGSAGANIVNRGKATAGQFFPTFTGV